MMAGSCWKAALMQPPRELVRFPHQKGLARLRSWAGRVSKEEPTLDDEPSSEEATGCLGCGTGSRGLVRKGPETNGVWKNFFIGHSALHLARREFF